MAGTREKLLTASDLAALCEVDLKTIHNWVERGRIAHFRTPGRHLRFRAPDVADFLRTWGYSVPRELSKTITKTVIVLGSRDIASTIAQVAGDRATLRLFEYAYDALICAGAEPADVYVIDIKNILAVRADATRFFEALQRVGQKAQFIGIGDDPAAMIALPGFVQRVRVGDVRGLETTIFPDSAISETAELGGTQRNAAVGTR